MLFAVLQEEEAAMALGELGGVPAAEAGAAATGAVYGSVSAPSAGVSAPLHALMTDVSAPGPAHTGLRPCALIGKSSWCVYLGRGRAPLQWRSMHGNAHVQQKFSSSSPTSLLTAA